MAEEQRLNWAEEVSTPSPNEREVVKLFNLNFLACNLTNLKILNLQNIERWFCFKSGGFPPSVPTDEPRYKSFVD